MLMPCCYLELLKASFNCDEFFLFLLTAYVLVWLKILSPYIVLYSVYLCFTKRTSTVGTHGINA